MLIKLQSVSKRFGHQQVINNCSFLIKENCFVALMGKSGAGKSTLLSLIAGLTNPDSGSVIVGDLDISRMSEEERAAFRLKNVGVVFQDFKLIPSLSVYDNVYLAIHPRSDVPPTEKQARTLELVNKVGLGNKKSQTVSQLSGGEKQRVAIARSLVNRPVVVLADEPTGNLDSTTAASILDLFRAMHRQFKTAFIIATHDQDVAGCAEIIYKIKDGVIQS
jgi:ABC-type lipoprotein export system ATPase subunit